MWGWRRVAHHAKLVEVRWVVRDGRRVALRKEVVEEMEKHLGAWRRHTKLTRIAEKRFGQLTKEFFAMAFYELLAVTRRQRKMRQVVIDHWRDVDRAYRKVPFRAWYLYMVDQKLLRKMYGVLVVAFRRRIHRAAMLKIVQCWREYTVYKAVETRSRSQLLE